MKKQTANEVYNPRGSYVTFASNVNETVSSVSFNNFDWSIAIFPIKVLYTFDPSGIEMNLLTPKFNFTNSNGTLDSHLYINSTRNKHDTKFTIT